MMLNDPQEQEPKSDEQSFADILKEFETTNATPGKDTRTASRKAAGKGRGPRRPPAPALQGTVVGIAGDVVLIDHGAKSEGMIPRASLQDKEGNLTVKVGDTFNVAITGFNSEGMATLSRVAGPRPRDWDQLTRAFESREIVAGRVIAAIKGGFSVDVGARGFLPASRSGIRDAAEMDSLVGQEIRCRVTKVDADREDVVLDRRSVLEEEADQARQKAFETLQEGSVVRGTVRSLASYGAFVDIGGVDGLLHVGDISWSRVSDPATALKVGDTLDVKILKLDAATRKISLGLKQLSPDPWEEAVARLKPGDRVTGEVTRLMDFGAFVEIMPGVEGLIHISEMSWTRRIQRASDVLKVGERVEAVVLKIDAAGSRLGLGLKQVLGNPWDTIKDRYPAGKIVEGKVTRLAQFGAFVELEEGIDGLIHVSEFTNEKRINHPSDIVKIGQTVRAIIVSADSESRRLKLSMKQLEATAADVFAKEVAVGDQVTGRIVAVHGRQVRVQLGEGVEGVCQLPEGSVPAAPSSFSSGSLAAQLAAAWKGGAKSDTPEVTPTSVEPYQEGQLRSFTIKAVDAAGRKIELTPA